MKFALTYLTFATCIVFGGSRADATFGLGKPKNVVLMISDGFGPASNTVARTFFQARDNKPYEWKNSLDEIIVGNVRTKAYDNWVTDSAAAATTYACGVKTYNAAIGATFHNEHCGTVVEAAKLKGLRTGLVTTTRVTHATPAGFSAHVPERDWEDIIAAQQVGDNPTGGRQLDLLMGGGASYFHPNTTKGSKRKDGRDLYSEATQKYGWKKAITTREEFDALATDKTSLPLLATFANSHLDYEIDRNATSQPSLAEMTTSALSMLKSGSTWRKGFFLMVEGGRIDHAGHTNDPAGHIHDIKAYWDAVQVVKDFAKKDGNTLVIHVSDHETGGLTAARQMDSTQKDGSVTGASYPYRWFPEALFSVTASTEKMASLIRSLPKSSTDEAIHAHVQQLIAEYYKISGVTDEEISKVVSAFRRESSGTSLTEWALGELLNSRAELGWTTHGHSGVDVLLGAFGKSSGDVRGSYENTEINKIIQDRLGLDTKLVKFLTPPLPRPMSLKRSEFAHNIPHMYGVHT